MQLEPWWTRNQAQLILGVPYGISLVILFWLLWHFMRKCGRMRKEPITSQQIQNQVKVDKTIWGSIMYTYLCPSFALSCSLTECINMLGHGVIRNSPSDKYTPRSAPTLQIMTFYWVRIDLGIFISYLSRTVVKTVGCGEWTPCYSELKLPWACTCPERWADENTFLTWVPKNAFTLSSPHLWELQKEKSCEYSWLELQCCCRGKALGWANACLSGKGCLILLYFRN